jgi:hypothetical protein
VEGGGRRGEEDARVRGRMPPATREGARCLEKTG